MNMKIQSKLILAFLFISLASLFVSNTLSFYSEKKNLTRQILNHLESVASIQHSRVKSIIMQNLERLALVSSRTQLRISLEKHIADENKVHQDKMNRILNDAKSSINDFKNISVFALDGKIVASTDHDRIGTGDPEKSFFIIGQKKNRADLLFLDQNQDLQLRLTGPLYLNNKLLGVMVIESSVENMVSSINDYTGLGTTGETVLARHNENGDTLFIMPTRFNRNAALKLTVPKEIQERPINLSFSKGHDILIDAVDYRGIQVFAVTRYVKETDWGIVVKIDRQEALAPVIHMRNLLAIIFLASAMLIILVSLYIAKSITRPVTELTNVVQEISQGDISVQAEENSIGEIGILAQAFNNMTKKLINAQAALKNKIEELQVEVKERSQAEEKAYQLNEELEQRVEELKQMQDALLESERKYKDLQDESIDGYAWTDMEGHLIEVNDAYKNMMGYSDDELRELTYNDITPEKWHASEQTILTEQILARGYSDPYEKELIRKDGMVFPVEISAYLIKNDQGNNKGMRAIVRDITERKQLEEEKQKFHKLESIGILAGGIAHDFNNLLAVILNNVYLSKMHIDRESKEYKNLESAEKAINRAANLTQQLLTFAKGGAPIKKTASIIEIIRESSEFALKGSNVKCEYIVADDIWSVEVDEGQMNQVIHNLILNADQAMPEGGTIRIHAENFDFNSGTGLPLEKGRYLKIIIQDQGIGIEKERLQKIFDPYFTTKEAGRGLGLSITYSIIKNHAGHISVESEIGTGTIFKIYLPASEEQVKEKEAVEHASVSGEGKILIMDDEELIRESVGEFLTMSGYEIEYAEDGDKAIDLYQKAMETLKPFDAVILDLTIRGGMGGKEAMKKLLDIDPGIKAIVSSGYSNDPMMANFREYGFSDVLIKPCKSPEELSKILHRVLNEQ